MIFNINLYFIIISMLCCSKRKKKLDDSLEVKNKNKKLEIVKD